ncbi:MAG: TRAP transporter small permease subunit [Acetobacteraceae bacterium]|jgi:TRAP-type C4-dicarboxylate transport system permease small subunit|nr:TRAP transporter small permease subunit [Acetobacteraceae bacterium]
MGGLYRHLCRAEAVIAGTFLLAMVALIFLGGVARMLGTPLNWTTDIATCLFAWACFLCANIAWRNNGLMAIELVTARLPGAAARALTGLNLLIISAFLAYVVIAGAELAWVSRARTFQGIPGVSYSWVTASLPAGAVLLLITTLLKLRDTFARARG